MIKVINAYYCHDEDGVLVTFDEDEARKDKNYRLATIDEVKEFIGLGLTPYKVIQVKEGIFGWVEFEYKDELGDQEFYCGYVRIGDNVENKLKDLHRFLLRINT